MNWAGCEVDSRSGGLCSQPAGPLRPCRRGSTEPGEHRQSAATALKENLQEFTLSSRICSTYIYGTTWERFTDAPAVCPTELMICCAPELETCSRLQAAASPAPLSGAVLTSMATAVPARRRVSLLQHCDTEHTDWLVKTLYHPSVSCHSGVVNPRSCKDIFIILPSLFFLTTDGEKYQLMKHWMVIIYRVSSSSLSSFISV